MPDTTPTLRDRIAAAIRAESSRVDDLTLADAVLAVLPMSGPCTCGGRFPLHHLHADTHEFADEPETDEQRADREETEREHAAGIHTHCGLTCEVDLPTEHLRNFVIA